MAKKTTTVTTTRVSTPQPETRIIEQTTTSPESRTVQQTTTTRVEPTTPRVVERTETVEKKGLLGGKKTTVRRDTVIDE